MLIPAGWRLLKRCVPDGKWQGLRMLELGDQWINDHDCSLRAELEQMCPWAIGDFCRVKEVMLSLGVEHVSIDWAGGKNVLVRDLRYPDCLDGLGQFDLVTNFGTIEHVGDQAGVWGVVDLACKPGGYMIHMLPAEHNWALYCDYRYTCEFVRELSAQRGYEVVVNEVDKSMGSGLHHIAAILRKGVSSHGQ
jgi:hypothetical protein